VNDADVMVPDVAARCEKLGLPQLLVDAGIK
jgi:hypothetical protein